jgi:CheY-like chemotaxis protein
MGNAVGVSGEEKGPFISVALMRALIDKYEAVKRSDAGLCDEDMYSILCEEASIRMGTSISPSSGDRDPTCRNPSAESDKICAVTPPSSRDGSDKLTVLVVDDSPLACKLALRVLRMGGHHADAVLTGNEGVSTLRNFPGKYDLVLLDIVMPEMDGIEVLSRIKAIPALVKVPVVMLSGLEDQTLAETCLHQGASAVLLKPLNPESVANVIGKQIMNKKKGSRVVAGGGVMPTLVPEDLHPVSVGSPAPELALVDAHQQAFTLDQVKKGKPIVLLFLPQGRDHNTGAAGALIGELAGSLREFKACHAEVCAVGQARVLPVVAQLGIRPLRDPDLGAFSRYMRAGERSVQTGLDVLGVIALNGDRTVVFSWGSTVIEQDVAKGVFVPRAEKVHFY